MFQDLSVHQLYRKGSGSSWFVMFIVLLLARFAICQTSKEDSLLNYLAKSGQDTNRVMALIRLADLYRFARPQEAVVMMQEAKDLSVRLNFKNGEVQVLNLLGETARVNGEYTRSLEIQLKALEMSRTLKNAAAEANSLTYIGLTYTEIGDYHPGLDFLNQAFILHDQLNMTVNGSFDLSNIGYTYEKMGLLDSALFFQLKAREYLNQAYHIALENLILTRLGQLKLLMGQPREALALAREALNRALRTGDMRNQSGALYRIAEAYYLLHQPDSSLFSARLALSLSQELAQRNISLDLYNLLTKLHYENKNLDSAFYYQQLSIAVKDSLFGPQKIRELQLVSFNEFQRQQKMDAERLKYRNRVKIYSLLALVLVFFGMGALLYRNNVQKQKANQILAKTLADLRSTQSQLIQSEKMASLGELTAGIAHEIQNPLNFVNNFAEVNKELLDEIQGERKKEKGARNEQAEEQILLTLKENQEKILQHGKRADAIVKGMLQHSQKNVGVKEPTDINALSEEYLRLAYHGFRAKDPNFSAELRLDLDPALPMVNVIPQDIGSVFLNLYNNAFWAVGEKSKNLIKKSEIPENQRSEELSFGSPSEVRGRSSGIETPLLPMTPEGENASSTPTITLTTKNLGNLIEIRIRDNGPGIPQNIIDKIFQPFFTTRPTGQGTGLGLSLAFDIVKAHGGELRVITDVGKGSEFIIQLPV